MKSRYWLLGAAMGLVLSGQAQAQDWSGAYAGVHGGYAFGSTAWRLVRNAGNEVSGQVGNVLASPGAEGFLGGVQLGYNRQFGRFVAGVEGEVSFGGPGGYGTWTNQAALFRDARSTVRSTIALTARGGVAFNQDRGLAFIKGGLALVNGRYVHTEGRRPGPASCKAMPPSWVSWRASGWSTRYPAGRPSGSNTTSFTCRHRTSR